MARGDRALGIVLGAGAIGTVLLLARRVSAASRGSPREEGASASSRILSHSARQWEALLRELGPDVPIAPALAWIDQESGGNVCAIGNKPPVGAKYPTEYGLSQLDAHNPENVAIMSQEAARASCQNAGTTRADWEVQLRPLTDDERVAYARAALDHMRSARDHAQEKISTWGWDPRGLDAWKMNKLYHAGPAYVNLAPAAARKLGRPPRDFTEFKEAANPLGRAQGHSQASLDRAWNNVAHFASRVESIERSAVA